MLRDKILPDVVLDYKSFYSEKDWCQQNYEDSTIAQSSLSI